MRIKAQKGGHVQDLTSASAVWEAQTPQWTDGAQPRPAHPETDAHKDLPKDPAQGGKRWWPGTPVSDLTLDRILANDGSLPFGYADLQLAPTQEQDSDNSLPLTLTVSKKDLDETIDLRRLVYSKHGRAMDIELEAADLEPRTAILGVHDNDGELFASMRVCFDLNTSASWYNIQLPASFEGKRLAFFERLAIRSGGMRAARAKQRLFKGAYLMALANDCDHIMISTLSPLNRLFEAIGFENIFGDGSMVTVDWYADPVYVLSTPVHDKGLSLLRANRNWYDHIMTPDPRVEAVIAAYFEQVRGRLLAHDGN